MKQLPVTLLSAFLGAGKVVMWQTEQGKRLLAESRLDVVVYETR